ncbi:MAG: hypothetical protein ABFC65_04380 [Rectinema sp.]
MKNESGLRKESSFLSAFRLFQKIAQATVCVLWLILAVIMLSGGSSWWRTAFDVCSVGLLGLSIFNAVFMVSFSLLKRERFSPGRFLMLLLLIVLATLALAVRSYMAGIRLY